jgi:hypothetical protein
VVLAYCRRLLAAEHRHQARLLFRVKPSFYSSACAAVQVERVVAERPGAERCLLVKWEGLPYCECSWEAEVDVMAARGGPEARDEFLVRQQRLLVRRLLSLCLVC